jgi:glycosyltransferase involved in cell wall biosynthesis
MRILALTNLYPNPQQPHKAAYNRQYFRALAAAGHAVHVIAPIAWTDERAGRRAGKPPLPADRRFSQGGIDVVHPRFLFTPKVLRGLYGHFYRRSVRAAFDRAVQAFRPDVVLASWAYPDGWAAVDLAHRAGLPAAINVVGSDVRLIGGARMRRTAEAVRSADGVWAVSQDLANRVVAMGAPADRVRVIYNGVDTALFNPGDRAAARARLGLPAGGRALLFVGNLVDVKGIDVLIDALAVPGRTGDASTCHLIGQGPLRAALERRAAAAAGVANRVKFVGPVAHDRLPDWFRAADLVVLPSRSEGVPNVLLEAAACGTPYVASRVGGIPEIADRAHCRLVPAGDAAALADGINRALGGEFDNAAQPDAPSRSFDDAAAEVAEFLDEVIARVRPMRSQVPLGA